MYDKHLDTFLMVADCGSFSKAAEKVFISPNAIIKQINLLENDLGVTLFERSNHGIKLTDAGASIYHDAKRIISLSEQSVQKAKQIERAKKQAIRIGTSLLRPCKTIVNLWAAIDKNYPGIELQIVPFDDTYDEWLNLLENLGKDIDVVAGIYPSTMWKRRCQILKITDVPLCCAVSRKNPLSSKSSLSLRDLDGETLLMVERGDTLYIDALRDEIEQHHPNIHIQDVPSYDTKVFNQCESSGCIMITISTWAELHPSLVTIPCDWEYTVPYGIVYSQHPSDLVLEFIEAIKQHCERTV
ncbi:MAG: LysR family transcriptional regulator [Ruminococcus flavefaciens]|nr:LysR family transcriptional regulator [Ruminococcus flavefaciens]